MDSLVCVYEPSVIEELEMNYAVFRTLEMRDRYEANLEKNGVKGYYMMTGSVDHCDESIHIFFSEHGLRYVSLNDRKEDIPIVFLRQNRQTAASYIKEAFSIRCRIKNVLKVDNLRTNFLRKGILHNTIPNEVTETYDWKDFTYPGGIWILKLDRKMSYQGKDNFIITSEAEWLEKRKMVEKLTEEREQAKKRLLSKQHKKLTVIELEEKMETNNATKFTLRGAIVSRYITNPMLTEDGRKFHLRPYIMVRSWDKCVISPFALLVTAKLPYKNEDFENPLIHDSHLSKTDRIVLVDDKGMMDAIRKVCRPLMDIIDSQPLEMYEEAQFGYQIFGPDILFDDKGNAYILEVNTTPLLGDLRKDGILEYEKAFSHWEFENGILPNLD